MFTQAIAVADIACPIPINTNEVVSLDIIY